MTLTVKDERSTKDRALVFADLEPLDVFERVDGGIIWIKMDNEDTPAMALDDGACGVLQPDTKVRRLRATLTIHGEA